MDSSPNYFETLEVTQAFWKFHPSMYWGRIINLFKSYSQKNWKCSGVNTLHNFTTGCFTTISWFHPVTQCRPILILNGKNCQKEDFRFCSNPWSARTRAKGRTRPSSTQRKQTLSSNIFKNCSTTNNVECKKYPTFSPIFSSTFWNMHFEGHLT